MWICSVFYWQDPDIEETTHIYNQSTRKYRFEDLFVFFKLNLLQMKLEGLLGFSLKKIFKVLMAHFFIL